MARNEQHTTVNITALAIKQEIQMHNKEKINKAAIVK
jgi:hypothetical protein